MTTEYMMVYEMERAGWEEVHVQRMFYKHATRQWQKTFNSGIGHYCVDICEYQHELHGRKYAASAQFYNGFGTFNVELLDAYTVRNVETFFRNAFVNLRCVSR